jgi:hypothetical protein
VRVNTSQREQYGGTVHLFIGTGHSPDKITFMPLITNHDYNTIYQGLCSLFLIKSVLPFVLSVSSCRSSFSCIFDIHLHVTPTCLLSCRRCFCLEDLRRRRRPPTSGRTNRHLAFLPQQPTRTTRQLQRKEEAVDVFNVGNKVNGESVPEESSLAAASFQHLSKTRSITASTRRPWPGLQPCKGEPLGDRSNLGCTRCGSRYVSSQIPSNKNIV